MDVCVEFNEVQTDKRNTYRKKVAADKASGRPGSPRPGDGEHVDVNGEGQMDRDGQPAPKKARRESGDVTMGEDVSDMPEGYSMNETIADEEGEDEEGQDAEDDEDDGEQEERLEVEEPLEEPEQREMEDEALDNGEDSD
jgi:DNA polymerase epsilon subunit 3